MIVLQKKKSTWYILSTDGKTSKYEPRKGHMQLEYSDSDYEEATDDEDQDHGVKIKEGDMIKMVLNTKQKTLQFIIDKKIDEIIHDIDFCNDIAYHLTVHMDAWEDDGSPDFYPTSVQIIDFQCGK